MSKWQCIQTWRHMSKLSGAKRNNCSVVFAVFAECRTALLANGMRKSSALDFTR